MGRAALGTSQAVEYKQWKLQLFLVICSQPMFNSQHFHIIVSTLQTLSCNYFHHYAEFDLGVKENVPHKYEETWEDAFYVVNMAQSIFSFNSSQ